MSDINLFSVNPSSFLRAEQNKQLDNLYWNWFYKFPEGWIEKFIEEGLVPFLEKHGYAVAYSKKEIVNYCKSWAFGHVQISLNKSKLLEVSFLKTKNFGGQDEYDWFTYRIPSDEWIEFVESWSELEFFDDTGAGESQKVDFPLFVWHILLLESSKAHQDYLYFMNIDGFEQEEETNYQPLYQDEQGAYGGDRRTL
jgi:hypothetical protein